MSPLIPGFFQFSVRYCTEIRGTGMQRWIQVTLSHRPTAWMSARHQGPRSTPGRVKPSDHVQSAGALSRHTLYGLRRAFQHRDRRRPGRGQRLHRPERDAPCGRWDPALHRGQHEPAGGVILHGLKGETIAVNGEPFSIYIVDGVSCAHGALVHGPCVVGRGCSIGFNAIVFNAVLGEGVYVGTDAVVTNGVRVAPRRFVPPGAVSDSQAKANALSPVPASQEEFAREVQRVNSSCGLACERSR